MTRRFPVYSYSLIDYATGLSARIGCWMVTIVPLIRKLRNRPLAAVLLVTVFLAGLVIAGIYAYAGVYGLNATFRRGGSIWVSVKADDPRLSASMRLALGESVPTAEAGPFQWRRLDTGFKVAELPAVADGSEVDRILLARIDPARFRFEVRNAPSGNRNWTTGCGSSTRRPFWSYPMKSCDPSGLVPMTSPLSTP